jgi:ankyrin repeat protein
MPVAAQEKPVFEDRSLIDKARAGDLEGLRLEILSGANVNERGLEDGTALHAAADWGHAHVVRALLELGAQPDRRDANRATALSLAARRGYIEVVDILLAGGADPNRVAQDNEVPLISAARLGFHQIVSSLLAAGADPEETDSTGRTARDWATIMRLQQVLLALDKAEGAR